MKILLYAYVFCALTAPVVCLSQPLSTHTDSTDLTILIENKNTGEPIPAWLTVAHHTDQNIGGWYSRRGPKGFPSFSPVQLKVPSGELTISAWNHESDEVILSYEVNGSTDTCTISLTPRVNLHHLGYFSFDSHNHLNGYDSINRPPFLYSYCAALGIDHLDLGQGWLFGLRMPVGYDSLLKYFRANSTPDLSLRFGAETPKLRYGHTWYVNHPGLKEPFRDYLKWHDPAFVDSMKSPHVRKHGAIDLRQTLRPQWHPPFVDRLRNRRSGAFSAAAHPTRWWNDGVDQLFPVTNLAADLAFDLLAAQSYDGIVVMGDHKDNIFYQNLWFHTLNLGYRLVPVAETDGNISSGSLGYRMLTFAKTGATIFHFDSLLTNIKRGHTTLSGRAIMLLNVDGLPPGSELPALGKRHTIDVTVYSEPAKDEYVSFLVLYRNGKPIERVDLREKKRKVISHRFEITEKETAWYVVKSYGKIYPQEEIQFDVIAYAKQCLYENNSDYTKNTGVSFTAPIYFRADGDSPPARITSEITGKLKDGKGRALKRVRVEIWDVDSMITTVVTDRTGQFNITAPPTIDIRFTTPDGTRHQQWLFYEYPPLLDIMEHIYTLQWIKKYPGIQPGQVPWEALQYEDLKSVLAQITWDIRIFDKSKK